MIPCDFCDELATYIYVPQGIVAYGAERLCFCQEHLTRYYLGLHYAGWRA